MFGINTFDNLEPTAHGMAASSDVAGPEIAQACAAPSHLRDHANAASGPTHFGPLRKARAQLQVQTSYIAELIEETDLAARLAPSIMGVDGCRTNSSVFLSAIYATHAALNVDYPGGKRLDFSRRRSIACAAGGCNGDIEKSAVKAKLTTTAPDAGLTDYIAGSPCVRLEYPFLEPAATNMTSAVRLAANGAETTSTAAHGEQPNAFHFNEHGRPVCEIRVDLGSGPMLEIKFLLQVLMTPGESRIQVQLLVEDVTPVVSVPECA